MSFDYYNSLSKSCRERLKKHSLIEKFVKNFGEEVENPHQIPALTYLLKLIDKIWGTFDDETTLYDELHWTNDMVESFYSSGSHSRWAIVVSHMQDVFEIYVTWLLDGIEFCDNVDVPAKEAEAYREEINVLIEQVDRECYTNRSQQ